MMEIKATRSDENSKDTDSVEPCFYKDLFPAKGYYLFQNFTLGCFIPFVYLFYLSIGLSITQGGMINGVRQIFAAVATFLIGYLIDYTGNKRVIMLTVIIMNTLLVVSTPFALYPFYKNNKSMLQNNLTTSKLNSTNFIMKKIAADQNSLFFVVLFWFILLAITRFPLVAIIDSTVINLVKTYQGKANYGMQRVFGPIGFTIGSLLSGLAMDMYQPSHGLSKFTIVFLLQIPIYMLMFACAAVIKIVNANSREEEYDVALKIVNTNCIEEKNIELQKKTDSSIMATLYQNCKNVKFLVFIITLFVSGLSFNIISSCLSVFLKDMNASKTMIGATISISSASEILIFPFSTNLIKLLGGTYKCLCIGIFSYGVRFFIYYLSTSPWHVFMAQVLQTFSFGLFWAAAMEHTYSLTKTKVSQSMFSLVNMVFFPVSSTVANFCGGFLYDAIGGKHLFLSMSVLLFSWCIVMIIFYIVVERHQNIKKCNNNEVAEVLLCITI